MKKVLLLVLGIVSLSLLEAQNVGIGTSTPNASAQLDVSSNNKGVLIPRIALTAANQASPVTSPADALLVYNTAAAGTGINAVEPGFYYWNAATTRWIAISAASNIGGDVGFGTWGNCGASSISEYNPAAADDGAPGDRFGNSVSISGNYAIAGSPLDDIGGNFDQGSAYIYFFNGTNWVQFDKLTALDGEEDDQFGYSVSISGNYAIVGCPNSNIGGNDNIGSAYMYHLNSDTWEMKQKLTASDGTAGDKFGTSVFVSGDNAIAGAPNDQVGGNANQGSAYIYHYDGSDWLQQPKKTASDGIVGANFGLSVSLSGNNAIMGAPGDQIGSNTNQGSAYVFFYNGSNWVQQQKIFVPDGVEGDGFGQSVSVSGNDAIIGGPYTVSFGEANGAAFIYHFNGDNWIEKERIAGPAAGDLLGFSVSIIGSYAMVSVPSYDIGVEKHRGAVFLYENINGNWWLKEKITNPGGGFSDGFGIACAMSGLRFVIASFFASHSKGAVVFGKVN